MMNSLDKLDLDNEDQNTGVIIVKTNVNPEKINSGRNLWTPKKVKQKKAKKKKAETLVSARVTR